VWATAWAARATTAATWLALGDSITEGQGASVLANRWTNQCLTLLRSRPGSPSTVGGAGWCPAGGLTVGPDSAWTSPTSPVPAYTGSAAAGYFWQTLDGKASTTNAVNDTMTWTTKLTSVDTWVIDSSAAGTYQVDALSAVPLTNGGNFPTLRVQRTASVSSASHTVQIKQTGAGVIGVDGIFVYDGDESNGIHLWNAGHYGALVSDLLGDWGTGDIYTYLQPFWINQVAPDAVTIGFGTNEFLNNISPTTFTAGMRRLIQILQSLPKIPTIYLLAMPTYDDGATHTFRWTAYQAALQQLATETPGVTYVDVMAVTGAPTVGGLFSTDQIHPSNTGHALIGQFVSGVLGGNPLWEQPTPRRRALYPTRAVRRASRTVVQTQTAVPPAYPPRPSSPRRAVLAFRRGRDAGPVPAQVVVPPPWPVRVSSVRRVLARPARGRGVTPVPLQVFTGPAYPPQPSLPRRMGRRLARPSAVTPVPVQVVPPPAWVPVRPMLRRVMAVLRRQHTAAAPVDQAGAPSAPRVRVRPTLRRRPSVAGPVPVQVVVPPSWVPQRPAPRRLLAAVVRRQRGDTAPPLDQGGPVAVPARRWRAPWRRRPSAVLPVPPQVFVGPAYPPAPSGPRRRGMLPRRARVSTPVPAQPFIGPAFVPQSRAPRRVLAAVRRRVPAGPPVDQGAVVAGQQRRLRLLWRRRPVVAGPVVAQEAPARVAPVRRPPAAAAASRVRRSVSPPIPQAAPPAARPTRARLATIRARRGKAAQPARPQDVIPAYPVRPSSPRRVLAAVRGLRRLTPKWIGVGLPAGVRPGRMTDGTTRGPVMDTGTAKGSQMTAGYRTNPDADTADDVTEGG
jgi:lysophospholipase L1-like esterase